MTKLLPRWLVMSFKSASGGREAGEKYRDGRGERYRQTDRERKGRGEREGGGGGGGGKEKEEREREGGEGGEEEKKEEEDSHKQVSHQTHQCCNTTMDDGDQVAS